MKRAAIATASLLALSGAWANAHGPRSNHTERLAQHYERVLAGNPQTFQFTNLRDITGGPAAGPQAAAGGASLVRSKNGLTARVMAADLEPGHAYTFWWILFNKPEECAQTPCGEADLMTASGAVHYGSGAVASENGVANVTFSTTSGGPPEGAPFNPTLPEGGLVTNRGFKAEVHLILVDHGIPALADFGSMDPDAPGTWGWELTHPLPPGPDWVRGAIFLVP